MIGGDKKNVWGEKFSDKNYGGFSMFKKFNRSIGGKLFLDLTNSV